MKRHMSISILTMRATPVKRPEVSSIMRARLRVGPSISLRVQESITQTTPSAGTTDSSDRASMEWVPKTTRESMTSHI